MSLLLENLFIPGIRNTRQFLVVLTSFGYSEYQPFANKQGQTASQKMSFDLVLLLKSPVKNLIISSEPSEKQSFPVGKSLWTVRAWLGLHWSVTNPVKSCYLYQPRLPPQKLMFQRWITELRQIPWKMFDCHRKIWKPATCESNTNQMTIHNSIMLTNIWSMKVRDYWTVENFKSQKDSCPMV